MDGEGDGDRGGNVLVVTSDGQQVACKRDLLIMSRTVRTILDDNDENQAFMPIRLTDVRSEVLTKIMEWCEHHKADVVLPSDAAEQEKRLDDVSPWDNNFITTLDSSIILDLFYAANYLDLKGLYELCLQTVASLTMGKNAEEIRKLFGITNDLTAADLEMIEVENSWIIDPHSAPTEE